MLRTIIIGIAALACVDCQIFPYIPSLPNYASPCVPNIPVLPQPCATTLPVTVSRLPSVTYLPASSGFPPITIQPPCNNPCNSIALPPNPCNPIVAIPCSPCSAVSLPVNNPCNSIALPPNPCNPIVASTTLGCLNPVVSPCGCISEVPLPSCGCRLTSPFLPAASPVSAMAPPVSPFLPPACSCSCRCEYLKRVPIAPPTI